MHLNLVRTKLFNIGGAIIPSDLKNNIYIIFIHYEKIVFIRYCSFRLFSLSFFTE